MRELTTFSTFGAVAAALLLALGLSAQPADAASSVNVTYDLSDTTLVWENLGGALVPVSNDDPINGTVSGSMKVTYASDSSSGMPILHDAAVLQTFNLTAKSFSIYKTYKKDFDGPPHYTGSLLSGTFHWQITSPATGALNSSGSLTGVAGNILLTGNVKCLATPGYCDFVFGLPTFTVNLNYSHSGSFDLAGSAGPDGGAQSTRHTLTGRVPAIYWRKNFFAIGSDFYPGDYGGTFLVGREVLREADGHDSKVIPEPGTLLLLGSGAAGLGLLGRTTRRARRS